MGRQRPIDSHLAAIHILELMILGTFTLLALFPEKFPRLAVLVGLALLMVPFGVRKMLLGRFTVPTLVNAPVALLLFVMVPIAVLVTPAWALTWPALLRLLWSVAVFYAVINWRWPVGSASTDPKRVVDGILPPHLKLLTGGHLGVGLLFTGAGLLMLQPTNQIPELGSMAKALERFVHTDLGIALPRSFNANRLAGAMLLYAPLAWALFLAPAGAARGGRRRITAQRAAGKLLLLLLAVLFTVVLLITQSRGGWLAFVLASGLLLFLLGRRGRIALAVLVALGTMLVALVGPTQLVATLTTPRGVLPDDAGVIEYVLADRNLSGRFMIWRRALHGIMDAPLTGVGLDAFQQIAQEPYPLRGFTPDRDIGYAHNAFLQIGLDLGIPGLIAYGTLLGMVLVALIRVYGSAPAASLSRFWSAGLLASLTAHLLWGITDAIPLGTRTAVGIWYLWGLGTAAGIELRAEQHDLPKVPIALNA